MPWRGARSLHETKIITWLIDFFSFLRASRYEGVPLRMINTIQTALTARFGRYMKLLFIEEGGIL